MGSPFNPLDKIHLGESIRDALLKSKVWPMPPGDRFVGAGIYAIYYTGNFSAYRKIAEKNEMVSFNCRYTSARQCPQDREKADSSPRTARPTNFTRG
ncbi:MAG: hypothetical protein M3Y72_23520 [Acidobacteriota bacterium]|nr:hypothetical protein [Acidobacteriota bacterium]